MTKSIKLVYFKAPITSEQDATKDTYRVIMVKNSIDYVPGEILDKDEVNDLCEARSGWEVTIVGANKAES
jgi:hypothetical protein